MKNDTNPYWILGLSPSATPEDIQSAYRRLSSYWHPDRNHDPKASEKFQAVQSAYAILSDPLSRAETDQRMERLYIADPKTVMASMVDQFFSAAVRP
ncbi:DnaJ domain-containing protein [Acidithiobacillus ferrivorans]|nr:DnaJ domain-containing protein [Acidithiobacillus ferrivorans]